MLGGSGGDGGGGGGGGGDCGLQRGEEGVAAVLARNKAITQRLAEQVFISHSLTKKDSHTLTLPLSPTPLVDVRLASTRARNQFLIIII